MRVVFMGTPELAASVLTSIAEKHDVVAVYTRPDAVRGRGKKLAPSPVKTAAESIGAPVRTATGLGSAEELETLRSLAPDVVCVAACSIILPPEALSIPKYGCLNVHTSLLPRWRGAAPMQRAIMARDLYSGVSIMRMEEGLDTGPYCRRAEVPLEGVYLSELQQELACEGSRLLLEALDELANGALEWVEQPEQGITYAEKLSKGELDLDPCDEVGLSCAKVRASDAAHPAHATIAGRKVIVERAEQVHDERASKLTEGLVVGQAVFAEKRMLARAADGIMEIQSLRPEGKKSMDARAFAAGIQGVKNATLTWGRA